MSAICYLSSLTSNIIDIFQMSVMTNDGQSQCNHSTIIVQSQYNHTQGHFEIYFLNRTTLDLYLQLTTWKFIVFETDFKQILQYCFIHISRVVHQLYRYWPMYFQYTPWDNSTNIAYTFNIVRVQISKSVVMPTIPILDHVFSISVDVSPSKTTD